MNEKPSDSYDLNVFINCPFDEQYLEIFNAVIFTVLYCGFRPRSAKEESDSGKRLDKIVSLIKECRYGIHDISRIETNENGLPRFNMPFELGLFLGVIEFGDLQHRKKRLLILDAEKYRYKEMISDLAGVDPIEHHNQPFNAVRAIRRFLRPMKEDSLPGANHIFEKYQKFLSDMPNFCKKAKIEVEELEYPDYVSIIEEWQTAQR